MVNDIISPNIRLLILSLKANIIGSYSISPRSVLKQTLMIQKRYRPHDIQSIAGLEYKTKTFGEFIYNASTNEEINPEDIAIVLIKSKSLTVYPLLFAIVFPLLMISISSLCRLIDASDKKINKEKLNNQNEIFKLVATPPANNLSVYSPARIKISTKAFLLK